MSLLFADRNTALQLLAHRRVLGHEAGREAGQAHILDAQTGGFEGARGKGAAGCACCRCVRREIEDRRAVAGALEREVGRGQRLLFHDDLRRDGISRSVRGKSVEVTQEKNARESGENVRRWRTLSHGSRLGTRARGSRWFGGVGCGERRAGSVRRDISIGRTVVRRRRGRNRDGSAHDDGDGW